MTLSLKAAVSSSAARKGEDGIFGSEVQDEISIRNAAVRYKSIRRFIRPLRSDLLLLPGACLLPCAIVSEGMGIILLIVFPRVR
jgi:hypothetical protein